MHPKEYEVIFQGMIPEIKKYIRDELSPIKLKLARLEKSMELDESEVQKIFGEISHK